MNRWGMERSKRPGRQAVTKRPSARSERAKKRSADVLAYIIRHKREHDGLAPTLREIGDAVGISSTSVVDYHLAELEEKGKIRRSEAQPMQQRARAIEVVGGRWVGPEEESDG